MPRVEQSSCNDFWCLLSQKQDTVLLLWNFLFPYADSLCNVFLCMYIYIYICIYIYIHACMHVHNLLDVCVDIYAMMRAHKKLWRGDCGGQASSELLWCTHGSGRGGHWACSSSVWSSTSSSASLARSRSPTLTSQTTTEHCLPSPSSRGASTPSCGSSDLRACLPSLSTWRYAALWLFIALQYP